MGAGTRRPIEPKSWATRKNYMVAGRGDAAVCACGCVCSSARSTSEMAAALADALRAYLLDVRTRHSATNLGTRKSASERKGENRNEF